MSAGAAVRRYADTATDAAVQVGLYDAYLYLRDRGVSDLTAPPVHEAMIVLAALYVEEPQLVFDEWGPPTMIQVMIEPFRAYGKQSTI